MNINFTLFAQAIVFTAFIWFTVKFVWPPLLRAIEASQPAARCRPAHAGRALWRGDHRIYA